MNVAGGAICELTKKLRVAKEMTKKLRMTMKQRIDEEARNWERAHGPCMGPIYGPYIYKALLLVG